MDMMQRISRRTAIKAGALTAAAAGLTLAGCGSTTTTTTTTTATNSGPVTLNIMTWGGTAGPQKTFEAVKAATGSKLKNYSANIIAPGAQDADVYKALRLALSAKSNIPDLVQMNRTALAEFASTGSLRELDDVYGSAKNDLYAGALQLATYNGKLVAFPFELKSKLFFYRQDLLQQAGVSETDLNTTAGFLAAGQKVRAKFSNKYLVNLGPQPQQYILGEFLSAYDNARFYDQGSQQWQVTTNPAFKETFAFLSSIYNAGITLKIDDFSNDWAQAFKNEAILGVPIGNWMKFFLPGYATAAQSGKWAVSEWPTLSGGFSANETMGSEAGGSIWVIPAGAKNADAAAFYMQNYVLNKQTMVTLYKQNGGLTPLLKSAQGDVLDYQQNAIKPAGVSDSDWALSPQNYFGPSFQKTEFASYDTVKVFDYDPSATQEITILLQALGTVLDGKASVDAALHQAQSDMQSQISNPFNV